MKKPIFKSKSLPGLSKEELNKMTHQKLVSEENGARNRDTGHLANIRPKAWKAFQESGYIGSEAFYDRSIKGGHSAADVNLKNGIVGEDSKMAKYKKDLNRIKWAKSILPLGKKQFLPSEVLDLISNKTWHNIRRRSNLVIKLDKKGGYHNTIHYYKLNLKEVNKFANMPKPNFSDY